MNYTAFLLQNPWRKGKIPKDNSVPRKVFRKLLQDMDGNDITVITGSRQVGKTTLLMSLISHLLKKGFSTDAVFYFNLDDFNLHPYFKHYTDFIEFVQSEYKGFCHIFIDEIQRLENPGLFLKILYDLKLDMKLTVSGSSSLELKSKISEHLTGRKHTFEIYPFSFEEFLSTKEIDFYHEKDMGTLVKFHGNDLNKHLGEFVTWGGYPKVILTPGKKGKMIELKELYDSYIRKDVKDYLNIENISGYNNLVKGLALQLGNLVNYNELNLLTGLNGATVKRYIDYLEGTYIFKRIPPYFSNARKEISKAPKIYSYDTGLMNYVTGRMEQNVQDKGSLLENFVFSELVKKGLDIKFWRTGSGAEVDFIVDNMPVEVKSAIFKEPSLSKSFYSFLSTYHPETGCLFNENYFGKRKIENTTVNFYPLWAVPLFLDRFFGDS